MGIRGMDAGRTGMLAAGQSLSVIANNLANNQTTGFKRSDVSFQDLFYQVQKAGGSGQNIPTGQGVSFGKGTAVRGIELDLQQGPLNEGFDLDVAIAGPGFFRVRDSQGDVFYTRAGAFQPKGDGAAGPLNLQLGPDSVLVDPPLVLPGAPGPVTITPQGELFQGGEFVGQFELIQFRNPEGLIQVQDTLFQAGPATGPEIVGSPGDPLFGSLIDGFLEGANVDIAEELIGLLTASQAFNLSSQALTTGNAEVLTMIQLRQS